MHRGVVTCASGASLREVAGLLANNGIHAVVVVSPEEVPPRAVITDRDVVFAHATGKLDQLMARDAATEPTITVRATLDLRAASELMARHGTTHVVVTDHDEHRPIGILSSLDIAKAVAQG